MKFQDISRMNDEALVKKEQELKMDLMKLQAQSSTGTPPKNPNQIKLIKRTIAQIRTAQKNKEVTGEQA
ncbi:MAG: 50S ribosomal protein L29 [Candidatus Woesearchaeota archaeon]